MLPSIYEHDKAENENFDLISMLDDTFTMQDFKNIKRKLKKDKHFSYESLLLTAEQLEEDSREYYLKKFEPIRSEESYKKHIESMDELKLKKWKKDFYSDKESLKWHYCVNAVEHLS